MKAPPIDLGAAQRWFLSAITNPHGVDAGEEAPEAHVTRSRRLDASERLSIYARAYGARLIECLGGCFPALKRALGEDLFNSFAAGYLERYPSRSWTLGRLGDRFAEYLAETRPADAPPVGWPDLLIDLATLEWAVDEVFDGPGIEGRRTLQPEDIETILPARWPELRLRTAPCLRLLHFRFPINDYYTALRRQDGAVAPPPPKQADSFMMLTRRDFVVRRLELSHRQYELLSALQEGEPMGKAIARAAESCGSSNDVLAEHLRDWFFLWAHQGIFEAVVDG